MDNIINKLIAFASKSTIRAHLAAAIISGKNMLTKPCINTNRNIIRGNIIGSLHAEANAIINYYGKNIIYKNNNWKIFGKIKKNINLIVIRIDKNNNICSSRPCYNCLKMMQQLFINKVYYTDDNGNLIMEKIKHMISIQSSAVVRFINNKSNIEYTEYLLNNIPTYSKLKNIYYFIKYNVNELLPSYICKISNNSVIIDSKIIHLL